MLLLVLFLLLGGFVLEESGDSLAVGCVNNGVDSCGRDLVELVLLGKFSLCWHKLLVGALLSLLRLLLSLCSKLILPIKVSYQACTGLSGGGLLFLLGAVQFLVVPDDLFGLVVEVVHVDVIVEGLRARRKTSKVCLFLKRT
jgi:hypothetical protein